MSPAGKIEDGGSRGSKRPGSYTGEVVLKGPIPPPSFLSAAR